MSPGAHRGDSPSSGVRPGAPFLRARGRGCRGAGWRRLFSEPLHQVGPVDARRVHLDPPRWFPAPDAPVDRRSTPDRRNWRSRWAIIYRSVEGSLGEDSNASNSFHRAVPVGSAPARDSMNVRTNPCRGL